MIHTPKYMRLRSENTGRLMKKSLAVVSYPFLNQKQLHFKGEYTLYNLLMLVGSKHRKSTDRCLAQPPLLADQRWPATGTNDKFKYSQCRQISPLEPTTESDNWSLNKTEIYIHLTFLALVFLYLVHPLCHPSLLMQIGQIGSGRKCKQFPNKKLFQAQSR